jgi:hypothetical protein
MRAKSANESFRCCRSQPADSGRHFKIGAGAGRRYVTIHVSANRTKAVIIIKTTIEANRTTDSLEKLAAVTFLTFVAL